ncbi:hypothetical protein GUJ93_ZPchr0005g16072 [Zizania palustris]|uniref:Uncharacterized protein n=1 Tax=Zizania palustris TaxID=103762 RepID=A0A8J5S3Q3_ZIZPA|nr:hypothetical protein GUJ93_ZPchr0005g16072 [Zizania palustris]
MARCLSKVFPFHRKGEVVAICAHFGRGFCESGGGVSGQHKPAAGEADESSPPAYLGDGRCNPRPIWKATVREGQAKRSDVLAGAAVVARRIELPAPQAHARI